MKISLASKRPLALDLFCCAGGASMGLYQAGFDVIGVDIKPQRRYPFEFVQADALRPPFDLTKFDFIWASPPCQAYTMAARKQRAAGKVYPDLVAPTRRLLRASGTHFAIENVPGAPLEVSLKLNGLMFPELRVIRERWFELSWFKLGPSLDRGRGLVRDGTYLSVAGGGTQGWAWKLGHRYLTADCRRAMGINWMSRAELSQAIPPPYAEFIGRAALREIEARRAA